MTTIVFANTVSISVRKSFCKNFDAIDTHGYPTVATTWSNGRTHSASACAKGLHSTWVSITASRLPPFLASSSINFVLADLGRLLAAQSAALRTITNHQDRLSLAVTLSLPLITARF